MHPRMSTKEFELFLAFVRNSCNYVEFGTGGSTYVASQYVKESIISLDSSREWLDKVQSACGNNHVKPQMIHIDIGPVGDWGFPTDPNTKHLWPTYHEFIWNHDNSRNGDLYIIDGRFRVACFAQIVLNCNKSSLIMFHDFQSREHYHCVRSIAREIATSEDLSVFVPLQGVTDVAGNMLQQYKFVPA